MDEKSYTIEFSDLYGTVERSIEAEINCIDYKITYEQFGPLLTGYRIVEIEPVPPTKADVILVHNYIKNDIEEIRNEY